MRALVDDPYGMLLQVLQHATGPAPSPATTAAVGQSTMTDWIQTGVGIATLVTAIIATVGAWHAARWTKKQAKAAARQVGIAREQLRVAKNDAATARALADDQRRVAALAARRLAEERIDEQMPTVLIRATPGGPRPFLEERGESLDDWKPVTDELVLNDDDPVRVLRITVTFRLENVSDRIARVVVDDAAGGEHTAGRDGLLVKPHAEATFGWSRRVTSVELRDERLRAQLANTRPNLWVRDLGENAYDVVAVILSLPLGRPEGSRLHVSPSNGWMESVGTLLPRRVYDRLGDKPATGESPQAGGGLSQ